MTVKALGKVYLVGAGPGAADLLTLRAARLLGEADVVLHDALVPAEILAMAPQAQLVDVGKRAGGKSAAQAFINRRLGTAARRHRLVVRLKGGDPMLFGRAQEEIAALQEAGIACEVVPGVTAAWRPVADRRVAHAPPCPVGAVCHPRMGPGEPDSEWPARRRGPTRWRCTMASNDAAAVPMRWSVAAATPDAGEGSVCRSMTLARDRLHLGPCPRTGLPGRRSGAGAVGEVYRDAAAATASPASNAPSADGRRRAG